MSKLIVNKGKENIMVTTDLGGAIQIITNTVFNSKYGGDIEKLKADFKAKWKTE